MATSDDIETGQLGVDQERILEELIFSQAESLVDGVRELIQNGIDAPGSEEVTVSITPERTMVEDDGEGMDLTEARIRKFLTQLGKSTKRDDPEAIGMFGIGFGQALAKGRVTAQSGTTVVEFDANEWFREYRLYDVDDAVDGFRVEIDHYDDEVPDPDSTTWDDYVDDLAERFQFMELVHDVEVIVNGERVSDRVPEDEMYGVDYVHEDDLAYVALREKGISDWIKVYSAGLKVTSNRGHGVKGYVITKQNLDLNTARNEIRSGCDTWETVRDTLDDARAAVFREYDPEQLTDAGRAGVARLIGKGYSEFEGAPVLKDGDGEYVSYATVRDSDEMIWSTTDSPWAGKLATRGETVILKDDPAGREIRQAADRSEEIELPDSKDEKATARALGVFRGYEQLDDDEGQEKVSTQKMAIARVLAHKMGLNREIRYGVDDQCRAWTDGEDAIWLTDSAWSKSYWEGWVFQLWRVIAHEAAHNESSEGHPDHGEQFCRNLRDRMDSHEPAYLELVEEIRDEGINATVRQYRHVHGLDV
ncbi:hypothetical protein AArcSl_2304 [Halalkaliarchaeum desulfuricum]|uniref:Uncharacterized protein n=1 Tax=Halalkaliarchaeum desulfuricum TaxID=2055893 RepID=A0A343TLF5_9EURY|nr:ATP-binding protein [Halalkaliarchaeum desulfuricum]AUX09927.1 hypothetical protein AArcSl_2304 [Halalkaliarchaeum desulfuricum]